MRQLNELDIINKYKYEGYTLRHLSEIYNTNHNTIKRLLIRHKIEITRRKTLKPITDEHKRKIGESLKKSVEEGVHVPWNKGKKQSKEHTYKNMRAHLKYNVTLEWLMQFNDIDKLKFLNRSIQKERDYAGFTDEIYIKFIEKFYYDNRFTMLYNKWTQTADQWVKPSLDHIVPKSKGGSTNDLNNLQFLSWLENRAKSDIAQNEWDMIKKNIGFYL